MPLKTPLLRGNVAMLSDGSMLPSPPIIFFLSPLGVPIISQNRNVSSAAAETTVMPSGDWLSTRVSERGKVSDLCSTNALRREIERFLSFPLFTDATAIYVGITDAN